MRFFSRFDHRYIRSLLYMLQASEYDVAAFLGWYRRADDFRHVEKRKHIVWNAKTRALHAGAWVVVAIATGLAICALAYQPNAYGLASAVLIAIGIVYLLPYVLAVSVLSGSMIQKPIEKRMIRSAQTKLRAHPAIKIAIAGSYGKTSMREILKTVLSAGKRVAAPPGSYNTPLGIASFIETLDGTEEMLIFELGEYYPGDIRTLCEFVDPSWGIITGVNEAHLEKFGTLEKTAATVFELADYLGDNPVYVNAENETARANAKENHVLYSRDGIEGWSIENARTDLNGTDFIIHDGAISMHAKTKLLGLHSVGPVLAAAHIARSLGLTVAQVENGIAQITPFEHRLAPRTDASSVVTLDDSYNGNPDGVKAVIEFLASLPGRRFYVTPGLVEMGDKTEAVHREIGKQLAEAKIEQVVLIRNSVTPFIEKGLKEAGYAGTITWFPDGLSAYAALPHMTVSGDIVLLQNDWPDQYA